MKGNKLTVVLMILLLFFPSLLAPCYSSSAIALPSPEGIPTEESSQHIHTKQASLVNGCYRTKASSTKKAMPRQKLHLTIAHTNDIHGHLVEKKSNQELGYAKLASMIKRMRQNNPNTLLVDAGDLFQGTLYANVSRGECIPPLVNDLSYRLTVAGNHEFDYGVKQLLKLRSRLHFPLLSANIVQKDGSLLLEPYTIVRIEGYTFAFLGLTSPETSILAHPDRVQELTFLDPLATAEKWVPKLKQLADEVILVSHCGIDKDRELARHLKGIPLIIGGHSHTKLAKPEVIDGVTIVQDGEYGQTLGKIDLYYDKGKLVQLEAKLVPYSDAPSPDPEMLKQIERLQAKTEQALNDAIATTHTKLDGERHRIRSEETNLGNLITDAMLERVRAVPENKADAALLNGGSIRSSIPVGVISKRELYEAIPFTNHLTIVELTGAELRAVLESGMSEVEKGAGRFPQMSGMSCRLDPAKPPGKRVSQIRIQGEDITDEKRYRIVINDYMAAGGDGYALFKSKRQLSTGITLYEAVEQYLKRIQQITYQKDGRIVRVS